MIVLLIIIGTVLIYSIGYGITKAMFETWGNNKEDSEFLAMF